VRERQQLVRGRHEHVEVLVVEVPGVVVRIAQVVDRVEEGLARGPERGGEIRKLVGPPGVEAEVQVEQVELVPMVEDPVRLERGRWPPLRLGPVRADHRVG
jgi:hypothetical protein